MAIKVSSPRETFSSQVDPEIENGSLPGLGRVSSSLSGALIVMLINQRKRESLESCQSFYDACAPDKSCLLRTYSLEFPVSIRKDLLGGEHL